MAKNQDPARCPRCGGIAQPSVLFEHVEQDVGPPLTRWENVVVCTADDCGEVSVIGRYRRPARGSGSRHQELQPFETCSVTGTVYVISRRRTRRPR